MRCFSGSRSFRFVQLLLAGGLSSLIAPALAGASVQFDATSHVFRLDGGDVTCVIGINEQRQLQSIYWGRRLPAMQSFPAAISTTRYSHDLSNTTTPQEFTGWGGGLYVEPDLKVTFPDGNRDLELRYVSHKLGGDHLNIVLKDISREIYVTLSYDIDPETGILARSADISNSTSSSVSLEQVAAGTLNLPNGTNYRVSSLTGRWAGEWNLHQQPVQGGKIVLESRRGTTGLQANPWFAIDDATTTGEEQGHVWFGALGWSGSWQITIEQDVYQQLRITGGLSPFDFAYKLNAGAHFRTPVLYAGFSNAGMGGASRLLHRYEIEQILPRAPHPKLRPVLYNSWEATFFNVTEAGQEALATKAASIGVERFVMDDGWFGARANSKAGLGDWTVNPEKFSNGLKPLIDKVHSLGMDFGLWVEPEMVNPDSDLYRKHPDWVLNFPGRPRSEGRNQLVLNLARPDVRDFIFHAVDKLLSENDIAFVKWDYNRNWSEPGWPDVPGDQQKDVYVDFTRNFYSILAELRSKHPNVEFESCSSGGGRVDLGVLQLTDEVWPSDNTDAFDRLRLQDGFTYAYSPGIMMSWVTDSPSSMNHRITSLDYRFLSSMQGSLGIGANLNHWAPEDFAAAKSFVRQYKAIRDIVQRGSLYRLISPQHDSEQSATESVSLDQKQGVVFAFLHSSSDEYNYPRLHLRGLKPETKYKLSMFSGKALKSTPLVATGAYWQEVGVDLDLKGDFQAAGFTLEAQ